MSRVVIALLAVSLTAGRVRAENQPAEPLRLGEVLAEARAHNPAIRAAEERARAAAAVPARVSALEDPTFSYEAWNAPDSLRFDRADNTILRLSQKVPFPGKRALAGTVAEHDAEVARREVEAVALEVAAAVKAAYYELWTLHQSLLVFGREKALVERFTRTAEQRYAVGEVAQSDVLRAQVEVTRLVNRVTTQTLALDGARAELNALLSRAPDAPLGMPEDPPEPRLVGTPEELVALALEKRPELAAQTTAIGREQAGRQLAKRNYLPDFEFAASRFINYRSDDGFGAFASVTIPLPYKSKYDAAYAEANARVASAEAELRRVQDRVRRDVVQAFVRARTALLQHELFVSTHIPQAEQAMRVTESGYQGGALEFGTVLETARALEAVHLEHFEAAGNFQKAQADLERAVGVELPGGVAAARPPHVMEGGER
jgi:outer membrane protein TolC